MPLQKKKNSSSLSGIQLNKGTSTVVWTATNGLLTSTCSITINVVDNQLPVITCPANLSPVNLNGKNCNTKIKVSNTPAYSDNCGSIAALTWIMTGATSGSSPVTGINFVGTQIFNAGITTITYTAKDAVGNSASCSFTVTVINAKCSLAPVTGVSEQLVSENKLSAFKELEVKVFSNPSNNYFTLKIESDNYEQRINLKVLDLQGRLVEIKSNLSANQTQQLGSNYLPGVYIAEILQGNRKKFIKLVKL